MSFSALLSKKHFLTLWLLDHFHVVCFTLLIARNTVILSHGSLLQKLHWQDSIHQSSVKQIPVWRALKILLLPQTEPNTELLLLVPLLSLVIKLVPTHPLPPLSCLPSAPVSWDVTGASLCWRGSSHVGPQPLSVHVFVCSSVAVISRGKGGRGRPREAGPVAEQPRPLSFVPAASTLFWI